jgi:hypothetical protein
MVFPSADAKLLVMSDIITEPSAEQIRNLARRFWEEEGQPEGKAEEHWARAQEQLRNGGAEQSSDGNTEQQPGG